MPAVCLGLAPVTKAARGCSWPLPQRRLWVEEAPREAWEPPSSRPASPLSFSTALAAAAVPGRGPKGGSGAAAGFGLADESPASQEMAKAAAWGRAGSCCLRSAAAEAPWHDGTGLWHEGGQDVGDLPPWRADAQPWLLAPAPAPALQLGACRGPIGWDWGPERGERRGSSAGTPKKALRLRPSRVSCSVSPGANRPGPARPACNRSPPAPYLGSTDGMRAARGADPWGRAVGLAQAVPSPTP